MSNRANSLPATAPSYEKCLRWEIAEQRANKTFMRGTERAEEGELHFTPRLPRKENGHQTNPSFRLPQVALDYDRLQAVWGEGL